MIYCGTFTARGIKVEATDGVLNIVQEGTVNKFIDRVEQITFSGEYANDINLDVTYITERAVFKLTSEGLELTEIAPGIDLEKDVLARMEFRPVISESLKLMDDRIFRPEKWD